MRVKTFETRRGFLVSFVAIVALVGLLGACGDGTEPESTACAAAVDPLDVVVVGELSDDERDTVDWVLQRFSEAGLLLPQLIEVGFDPTRDLCDGAAGVCRIDGALIPTTYVCEPAGDTAFRTLDRRMTLLHELAHVWHYSLGDSPPFGDLESIVGGTAEGGPETRWEDRSEERLASLMTWGLLDQLRRPVPTTFTCTELYWQFEAVTAHAPLGPLEQFCLPIERRAN
jgi:hypothetical protein